MTGRHKCSLISFYSPSGACNPAPTRKDLMHNDRRWGERHLVRAQVLRAQQHGSRVPVQYYVFGERHRRKTGILDIDLTWYALLLLTPAAMAAHLSPCLCSVHDQLRPV